MNEIAYYPGCSLHSTAKDLDSSFVGTMVELGVQLPEIPGWECCGNSAGHATNRLLSAALPANELAKVKEDMQLDAVAVPCAACFNRFQAANHEVNDASMAADIAQIVGRPYAGDVKVLNLVDVYHDGIGLAELAEKMVRPFDGTKVASYYGCLLTRPPKATLAEDPEYPVHMDEVLKAIGCSPIDWDAKTDCCGAGLAMCEQDVVDRFISAIVSNARERGAEVIVCACPLCQLNLDSRQIEIGHADPLWEPVPVVYLSQMVGHALGLDERTLGLGKSLVGVGRIFG